MSLKFKKFPVPERPQQVKRKRREVSEDDDEEPKYSAMVSLGFVLLFLKENGDNLSWSEMEYDDIYKALGDFMEKSPVLDFSQHKGKTAYQTLAFYPQFMNWIMKSLYKGSAGQLQDWIIDDESRNVILNCNGEYGNHDKSILIPPKGESKKAKISEEVVISE